MESLSSRHLRTKSSTHFSGKNAYAGVFSGPEMAGAPKAPSRLQDYDQIFNCSSASSIPVLDLSEQIDTNVVSNYKSSEMDYNDIFGGFSDEHIGVYYQDLVPKETKFSSNVRTQSTRGSPIKSSDRSSLHEENQLSSSEASFLSFDDKKHFNVSYHKTSPGSKDGSNGTIHVAQFHPEPGFAFFVDDSIPQESKASKPDSSVTNHIRGKLDFSDGILEDIYAKKVVPPLDTQSSSKKVVDSKNQLSQDGSNVNDKLLHADVINVRPHLTKVQLPSRVAANLEDKKGYSMKSTVSNHVAPEGITFEDGAGDGSPTFFGEEVDANSAAAVSAAALRDAIQKAQESIRIAKELMERRKGGLQNHSNQVFKDGLRVKGRKENFAADEENRSKNTNTKDTWENLDSLLNIFSGRRTSALRRRQDAPDLVNNERTSSFGKYKSVLAHDRATASRREPTISEMPNIDKNRASLSSPDQQAVSNSDIAQILNKRDYKAEERNIDTETVMKQEVIIEKERNTEKAHELEFIEKNIHAVLINNELEVSRDTLAKHLEMSTPPVSEEVGHCEKTEIESQQKIEEEVKFESHALKDFDYRMMVHKKQDRNAMKLNSQQVHIEETTNNSKEEASDIQKIICDEDLEEERFEDAFEWVQNDDEPKYSQSEESNEKGKRDTFMEEEVIRSEGSLVEVHNLIIEEKTSTDVDDHEESGENFGNFELKGSENGFRSACEYEKSENLQTGTKKMEELLQAEYESDVIRESDLSGHNASDNVTKTQEAGQPSMIDGSSIAKQQVDDKSRSIDTATKEFCDYEAGEAEEAKVAYKVYNVERLETASSVHVASEESEDMNSMKTVFEVLRSEGCLPKFSPSDKILESTEAKQRDKDLKSHTDSDNSAQIFVDESKQRGYIFEDDCVEKAVKSSPDISDEEGQDAVTVENLEEYPGPSLSSEQVMQVDEEKEIEKIIQVDEDMRESQTTQVDGESPCKIIGGKEEEERRSNEEMKTENVIEVNEDSLKEVFPVEGTGTEKAVSKGIEENRDNHEESKRERQREMDRIAVARAIQEARDRAFAGAKEKAERAAVERATAEVRQRVMAEAQGKLEKSTTAAKRLAEKDFIEAKLRSERAAVERATAEARARALEKALSQKATSRTTADKFVTGNISGPSRDATKKGLQRSDETYMESAQRSKARLEREERIMERAAKALAEKNMRDLLAQKEDAEKNRLAESLDIEIRRWSAGKEMNLRALLSTLQYILGPGSGWQPISLTDIITSNAVKKAYRKATLYVHPDKLQQRGASIREKYICEKVFDLLKAAWNRFSSEER